MGEGEPGEGQHTPENKIYRWEYKTHFEKYLYQLGFIGDEFECESIGNFPEKIELDSKWHDILDHMRRISRDGRERGIAFGYREGSDTIYFPEEVTIGSHFRPVLPGSTEAEDRYGIVCLLGTIHSHPSGFFDRILSKALISTKMAHQLEGFSPEDFYDMVVRTGLPIEAVAERGDNYFAFRTEETKPIPPDSPLFSKKEFAKHWYQKYGGLFVGNTLVGSLPSYSIWKMNIGIAQAYNLALYKGKPGEDLVRGYT